MKKTDAPSYTDLALIFGLKLKQLRTEKGLSFQQLAALSGMSVSYLNEIEKGKKYPKAEKIARLAEVLDVSYDWMVSLQLGKQLAAVAKLLQSKLINEIPIEIFGFDKTQLLELLSAAPAKLNAFINTMIELSRNYGVEVEDLYFSMLRSYQELHENYFEDIELSVEEFVKKYTLDPSKPINAERIKEILTQEYGYAIEEGGLGKQPELEELRSVLVPGKQPTLLLNTNLSKTQFNFILGREAAFCFMGIKERSYTTSWVYLESFDSVLNNFKGSYFSCALFLSRSNVLEFLTQTLASKTFETQRFQDLMDRFMVSPEILLHRLTNMLPRFFGISELFFLRFSKNLGKEDFIITKEMHLSGIQSPHATMLNEHYCRRWVSITILQELEREVKNGTYTQSLCRVQRSKYIGTDKEYLIISFAKPIVFGSPQHNSVAIGLLITDQLKKKIKFWNDPQIPVRLVSETCERCVATDCKERAEQPLYIKQQQRLENIKTALQSMGSFDTPKNG